MNWSRASNAIAIHSSPGLVRIARRHYPDGLMNDSSAAPLPEKPPARRAWLAWLVLLPMLVLSLRGFAQFLQWADLAVGFPYSIDYSEGTILAQAALLDAGEPHYDALATPPYRASVYPPVYLWVAWGVGRAWGSLLAGGRLLSALSTLAAVAAASVLVWRLTRDSSADHTRALHACACIAVGLSVLGSEPIFYWGMLYRPDAMGWALSLAAVVAYPMLAARGRWVWLMLPLLLLALYTKHSMIAAPLAIGAAWCLRSWKEGLCFCTALGVSGLALIGFGEWLTGGVFYENIITGNRNAFFIERIFSMWSETLVSERWFALLGLVGALYQAWHYATQPRDTRAHARLAALLYFVFVWLASASVGKVGSNSNYFIEALAISIALAGALAVDGLLACMRHDKIWQAAAGACAALLLAWSLGRGDHTLWIASAKRYNDSQESVHGPMMLKAIRETPGPVICEDCTYLILAGRPLDFEPFIMTQLSLQGAWDQRPFLEELRAGKYALIALNFELGNDPGFSRERFTERMLEAMGEAYAFERRVGAFFLYRPRQRARGEP